MQESPIESRKPLVIDVKTWERLRKVVDRSIPREIQVDFYNYLETKKKNKGAGRSFYRESDKGLMYLYWLLDGNSFSSLDPSK